MKYILAFMIVAVSLLACDQPVKGKNGVAYKSAVQYNDYIVGRQTTLVQNILDFAKAFEKSLDSAERMLNRYTKETEVMIHEIEGMPPYKGDSALRNAAIRSFTFYKKVFGTDYMRILAIRKKGADVTTEDMEEIDNIVAKISQEEEGFDKTFHNAQKEFADRNNMKLKENDMQKKLETQIPD